MLLRSRELACPECSSEHVRRSRERGFDRFLVVMGCRPFRCFDCGHRFRSTRHSQQFVDMVLPPSVTKVVVCPNCNHQSEMHLTPEERQLAESEGWTISCSNCEALFAMKRRFAS